MIVCEKELNMSRFSKFLFVLILVVFVLACNAVTQPINGVQNGVSTAQAVASNMPGIASTMEAIATNMPVETLQAITTSLPDVGNMFNPQGTPVKDWNGIPVMPQATAGQEFTDTKSYSFKATATIKDAEDFYNTEMVKLGWSSTFSMPTGDQVAILSFSKDSRITTITITLVVVLTSA